MKNIELLLEKTLKEDITSESDAQAVCLLAGTRQMYEASGSSVYLEFFMHKMEQIVCGDGSISMPQQKPKDRKMQCTGMGRELLWMYAYSGNEKYKKAADWEIVSVREQTRGLLQKYSGEDSMLLYLTQPFYMEYETKYHNKAEYKTIVELLSVAGRCMAAGEGAGWYLMALADVIGCMSMEIYEHYRFLEEILKKNVRRLIKDSDSLPKDEDHDLGILLGTAVLKACSQKNLNLEKYAQAGLSLIGERMNALDFVKRKKTVGLLMMAYAQFLRFGGGHVSA